MLPDELITHSFLVSITRPPNSTSVPSSSQFPREKISRRSGQQGNVAALGDPEKPRNARPWFVAPAQRINIYRRGEETLTKSRGAPVSIGGGWSAAGLIVALTRCRSRCSLCESLEHHGCVLGSVAVFRIRGHVLPAAFPTEIKVRRSKACRNWQGSIRATNSPRRLAARENSLVYTRGGTGRSGRLPGDRINVVELAP